MLGPEVLVWLETLNPKPSAVRIPESVPGRSWQMEKGPQKKTLNPTSITSVSPKQAPPAPDEPTLALAIPDAVHLAPSSETGSGNARSLAVSFPRVP